MLLQHLCGDATALANAYRVVSDVDECEDPAVCGTARCENTDGGYDCLCDVGYVYDNETRTCIGKLVCGARRGSRGAALSGWRKECREVEMNLDLVWSRSLSRCLKHKKEKKKESCWGKATTYDNH